VKVSRYRCGFKGKNADVPFVVLPVAAFHLITMSRTLCGMGVERERLEAAGFGALNGDGDILVGRSVEFKSQSTGGAAESERKCGERPNRRVVGVKENVAHYFLQLIGPSAKSVNVQQFSI